MTGAEAIAAIGMDGSPPALNQLGLSGAVSLPGAATQPETASFESILSGGLDAVNQKVAAADDLVRQFAVDDSIPVHRVTIALEEARLSVELAMQVRTRLVETYRELMNMQL